MDTFWWCVSFVNVNVQLFIHQHNPTLHGAFSLIMWTLAFVWITLSKLSERRKQLRKQKREQG